MFQGRRKVQFLVFLFLVWFVVLQVIVEWFWWAGFNDGVWSWLLSGYSLLAMWITILGEDWCKTFRGMKECGEKKVIWSWLKRRKVDFWRMGEAKFLFLLVMMCGVGSKFHSNQLGTKVPSDFFFSQTWFLIFHCAKSVRKRLGGLTFAF